MDWGENQRGGANICGIGPGGSRTAIFWDDDGLKTRCQLSPQIFAVHHRTRFANKISELGIAKYLHLTKHAKMVPKLRTVYDKRNFDKPGTLNNHFLMDGNGETTISQVKIWNHPTEITMHKLVFMAVWGSRLLLFLQHEKSGRLLGASCTWMGSSRASTSFTLCLGP